MCVTENHKAESTVQVKTKADEAKRTLRRAVNSIHLGELSGLKKSVANLCIDVSLKPVSGGFKFDPVEFNILAQCTKFRAERDSTDFAHKRFRKIFKNPQLKDIFTICAGTGRKASTLTLNIAALLPDASSAVQNLFPKVHWQQRLPSSETAAGSPQASQRSDVTADTQSQSALPKVMVVTRVRLVSKPCVLLDICLGPSSDSDSVSAEVTCCHSSARCHSSSNCI